MTQVFAQPRNGEHCFMPKSKVMEKLKAIGYEQEFWVTFAKSDGTFRTMIAVMPTPDRPVFDTPNNMPVIDVEQEQWRSFNLSRVYNITTGGI